MKDGSCESCLILCFAHLAQPSLGRPNEAMLPVTNTSSFNRLTPTAEPGDRRTQECGAGRIANVLHAETYALLFKRLNAFDDARFRPPPLLTHLPDVCIVKPGGSYRPCPTSEDLASSTLDVLVFTISECSRVKSDSIRMESPNLLRNRLFIPDCPRTRINWLEPCTDSCL